MCRNGEWQLETRCLFFFFLLKEARSRRWIPVEIKLHRELIKTVHCANVYPRPPPHQGRFRSFPIVLRVHSSLECDWWVNAYLHKKCDWWLSSGLCPQVGLLVAMVASHDGEWGKASTLKLRFTRTSPIWSFKSAFVHLFGFFSPMKEPASCSSGAKTPPEKLIMTALLHYIYIFFLPSEVARDINQKVKVLLTLPNVALIG